MRKLEVVHKEVMSHSVTQSVRYVGIELLWQLKSAFSIQTSPKTPPLKGYPRALFGSFFVMYMIFSVPKTF